MPRPARRADVSNCLRPHVRLGTTKARRRGEGAVGMAAFPFRRLIATTAAVLAGTVVAGSGASAAGTAPLREREFTASGAWSWFTDPRSVYHEGAHRRTFAGWVAHDGSVQVGSYDHDTGRRVVATLKVRLQVDDHDNPSILVRPDGRLMVFWSTHAGPSMWYRRSLHPEDITAWEPERVSRPTPPAAAATRTPTRCSCRPRPTASTCSGGAATSTRRCRRHRRHHLVAGPDGDLQRGRAAVREVRRQRPRHHRHGLHPGPPEVRADQHLLRRLPGGRAAPGRRLGHLDHGRPAHRPGDGEQVYDWETSGKAWVHDVALDAAGRPVIVYAAFPTDGDHRYRYARWDGARWVDREFARGGGSMSVDPREPNYSGGMSLDHDDPSIVYLSRQVGGRFEVEAWTTPDGGASWSSRPLTPPSTRGN